MESTGVLMTITNDELKTLRGLGRLFSKASDLVEISNQLDVSPSRAAEIERQLRQAVAGVKVRRGKPRQAIKG
ncbi:MAG TPA: hypothetical protein VHC22_17860 [Pirellulales bacterium]|nr:hypothetical protein [Pirellulales bacterium]